MTLGLASLTATAAAQEAAYDLRDLSSPRAGERRRVVAQVLEEGTLVVRRADGEVAERRTHAVGHRQAYVEEVEHVDAREGAVTQALRTYEEVVELGAAAAAAPDPAGEATARGVRVRVVRTPRGAYALERVDPEQPAPPALERVLLEEAGAVRDLPLVWRYERPRVWPVPAEPQRAGDAWDVPLDVAARLVDVPPEDVRAEGSSARGRLEEAAPGRVRLVFELDLGLVRFEGLPCRGDPVRLEVRLVVERSEPAGACEASLQGALYGRVAAEDSAAGAEDVELDLALSRTLRLEPLPP